MVVKKVMSYILCLENWENYVCFKSLVAAKFNILLQFQCVMNFSFQLFSLCPNSSNINDPFGARYLWLVPIPRAAKL